jgi:outer membrane murein-binding lipoprotein Lpp
MRKIATILCIFLAVALVAGCASSGGGDKAAGG